MLAKSNPIHLLNLLLEWSLKWRLSLWRDAGQVAALAILPINESRVQSHAVIPDDNGLLGPLDAGLEVGAVGDVVVEELEEVVGLLLLEADDIAGDWYSVNDGLK